MSMEKTLRAIGKDMDYKTPPPWWIIDQHIGELRAAHAKLLKMKPKKYCQVCKFYNLKTCSLAGREPPESVLAVGCEKFEDVLGDMLGA